jgi:hypothetical protein
VQVEPDRGLASERLPLELMLVFDYVAAIPDPARAAPYLRRATELITPEVAGMYPIGVSA